MMGMLWLRSEGTFALTGTVKDYRGAPIAGAIVSVVSNASVPRVTGANGDFTIDRQVLTGGKENLRVSRPKVAGLGIRGDCFLFLLPSPVPSGSIAFTGVDGRKRFEIPLGPFGPGAHLMELPRLAPGVYSLWIDLGPVRGSALLVHCGNRTTLVQRSMGCRPASENPHRVSAPHRQPAAAVDTLLVKKPGFVTARSPILSYAQAGIAIVMAKEPGRGHGTSAQLVSKAGQDA